MSLRPKFGSNVNLGNIVPSEVISLETLRLGLRSDTLFDFYTLDDDMNDYVQGSAGHTESNES